MSNEPWSSVDAVALRDFFARVEPMRLKEILQGICPAVVNEKVLLDKDDAAVARISAMAAGWNGAIDALINLSKETKSGAISPGYSDMT